MTQQTHSPTQIRLKDLLALKQQTELMSLPATNKNVYTGFGNTKSPFKSRGLDFQEVRVYQPGDDIRLIDWHITAKYGKPFTKLYTEDKDRALFIICDLRSNMDFASHGDFKSVIAARMGVFLAFVAAQKKDRIGAAILTDSGILTIPPENTNTNLMVLLQTLTHPVPHHSGDNSLYETAKVIAPLLPSGSYIFVLSDFCDWDARTKNEFSHFSTKHTLLLCPIYDQLETKLPKGTFSFSDGKHTLVLDTSKSAFQKKFSNAWEQKLHALQNAANNQGWGLMPIATDCDYLNLLGHLCLQGGN